MECPERSLLSKVNNLPYGFTVSQPTQLGTPRAISSPVHSILSCTVTKAGAKTHHEATPQPWTPFRPSAGQLLPNEVGRVGHGTRAHDSLGRRTHPPPLFFLENLSHRGAFSLTSSSLPVRATRCGSSFSRPAGSTSVLVLTSVRPTECCQSEPSDPFRSPAGKRGVGRENHRGFLSEFPHFDN